ncbi:MAG: hypothetical protein R3E98_05900 [Gemmatimonadota bacterium]|nr:hypothetical protein [Gemmatimonadota bacterium]
MIGRACALLLLTALPAAAQAPAAPAAPLFAEDEPLVMRLVLDVDAISGDRSEDAPERPGLLFLEATGHTLPVDLRTRGNFRLRRSTCGFPPLRLDLPRSQLAGTVFEGQDKLKLVSFCRDENDSEQDVLEEYLAYRVHTLVSPWALRVRLVRMTYADLRGREDPVTRYGFLIEDEEAAAQRLGGTLQKTPLFDPTGYVPRAQVLTSLFQFMIGNTDWSIVEFHNAHLLHLADGSFVPLVYDFDFSGLVDAPYAVVNPTLGIESVRERAYRGFCVEGMDYLPVFAELLAREADVLALVDAVPGLSRRNQGRARDYLASFFEMLRSEGRRDRYIVRSCRSVN